MVVKSSPKTRTALSRWMGSDYPDRRQPRYLHEDRPSARERWPNATAPSLDLRGYSIFMKGKIRATRIHHSVVSAESAATITPPAPATPEHGLWGEAPALEEQIVRTWVGEYMSTTTSFRSNLVGVDFCERWWRRPIRRARAANRTESTHAANTATDVGDIMPLAHPFSGESTVSAAGQPLHEEMFCLMRAPRSSSTLTRARGHDGDHPALHRLLHPPPTLRGS